MSLFYGLGTHILTLYAKSLEDYDENATLEEVPEDLSTGPAVGEKRQREEDEEQEQQNGNQNGNSSTNPADTDTQTASSGNTRSPSAPATGNYNVNGNLSASGGVGSPANGNQDALYIGDLQWVGVYNTGKRSKSIAYICVCSGQRTKICAKLPLNLA